MSESANVRSVDALNDFKVSLVAFGEDARVILDGVDMEVRRTRNWLERDQLAYWRAQVKRREQEVAAARTELHRRKISQMNSDAISDTDQKEALKLAQRRLVEAEEMVEKVKRWIPVFDHAIAEYRSQSQPLADHLSGGFESTLSLLDRMVAALDAYAALAAPEAPSLPSEGVTSAAAAPAFESAANPASSAPEAAAAPVEAQSTEAEAPKPTDEAGVVVAQEEPVS